MLKPAFKLFSEYAAEVSLPKDLRNKVGLLPSGDVTLTYSRYQTTVGSDVRFMSLQSQKIDVQTLFVYPSPLVSAAVFAAETVVLGNKPAILVLDMPILFLSERQKQSVHPFHEVVRELAGTYSLENDLDLPTWYQECRSGIDIFIRPNKSEQSDSFINYLNDVTSLYLQHWHSQAPCNTPEQHLAKIQSYKHHHLDNSPGVPLMQRCFGKDWTTEFMDEFFY